MLNISDHSFSRLGTLNAFIIIMSFLAYTANFVLGLIFRLFRIFWGMTICPLDILPPLKHVRFYGRHHSWCCHSRRISAAFLQISVFAGVTYAKDAMRYWFPNIE